jgi:CPA1 family monovalent cation:H+ antiporter
LIDIGIILFLGSVLLVVAALVQPLAHSLRLPPGVLLAAFGVGVASLAWFVMGHGYAGAEAARTLFAVPLHSKTFLYGFLPPLLFQAALTLDIKRMVDDAAPILLLAVVAVVVATGVVGWSLAWLSGSDLTICLLLGAIIATTDPAAVIAVFRDIGAPARLTRLVEGESLLNDAAAIALFTVLLGMITGTEPGGVWEAASRFVGSFAGGLLLGIVVGRILVFLVPFLRGISAAEFTLTLAAPWLAFIIGERVLEVSGVVAVVSAGITFAMGGPGRFTPQNWAHLQRTWEQLAAIGGSLVFVLAAVLVPRLVSGVDAADLWLILAVIVAAFVARALVLFLLLPLLSSVGLGERVSGTHKLVILWGGLRGAVTLALALSITENPLIAPEVKRFVAMLATGFVLFTLFVNGVTLRSLMRLLRLDRLSPDNQALRDEVLALALSDVAASVREAGQRFGVGGGATERLAAGYAVRARLPSQRLSDRQRLKIALLALAHRERELILAYNGGGSVPVRVVDRMLRDAGRLFDGARTHGRYGYTQAARRSVRFSRSFRIAYRFYRHGGWERPLAARIEERFVLLLMSRLVLSELGRFAQEKLRPLVGERVAQVADEVLDTRRTAVMQGLDALRLQYPDYAEALEERFLAQYSLAEELRHYDALLDDGLIGDELHKYLRKSVRERLRERLPQLDLGLDTRALMQRVPLFAELHEEVVAEIAALLRPVFVVPGVHVVRMGGEGDGMYFLSSGAVEVRFPHQTIRLGRGDFFGELALINRQPRSADVVSLTYSQLLWLSEEDFRTFLESYPVLRERLEAVAMDRQKMALATEEDGLRGTTAVEP